MLNKIKIIYLVLLISLFAISCNNNQNKNVDDRVDSIEVSDTTQIEKRDHFFFVGHQVIVTILVNYVGVLTMIY